MRKKDEDKEKMQSKTETNYLKTIKLNYAMPLQLLEVTNQKNKKE